MFIYNEKVLWRLVTSIMVAFVITFCAVTAGLSAERYIIRFGHLQPVTDPWHKGAVKFKEVVEDLSEGQISVQIFPAEQLGSEREQLEGVRLGTQEISTHSPGMLATVFPKVAVFGMPYIFRDQSHIHEVLESPVGQKITAEFREKTGLRVVGFWDRGPRYLTSNKPVWTADDVKGLKIRVPEVPTYLETWRALGAKPTPIAFGELYTALALGTVEAQENPLEIIWNNKFFEVQDYLCLTGHLRGVLWVVMNDSFYQRLPKNLQKVVDEAFEVATDYTNDLVARAQSELLQKLIAKGMKVTIPNVATFEEATKDVYKKFAGSESFSETLYFEIKEYEGR